VAERWIRITAQHVPGEPGGLLAEGFVAAGGGAVEERGDAVITYIEPEPGEGAEDVAARVRSVLGVVMGPELPELLFEEVPEEDWLALWRSGLAPRRMGRIIVAPTWSDVDPSPDDLVIRIDPQMAFGTGEHASTRGVLRLMQQAVRRGDRVIDVGAGSAILAIAAAQLGAASAAAVESDPDATENALENIARNGVEDRVTFDCRFVDDGFLDACGSAAFDGILANVLSSVLKPLLPAFHRSLPPGGWAILSGILLEEAPDMRDSARAAGFAVEAEDAEEQWWSVLLRR
jgi:ribosomal protein L11 methyltransferase